MATGGNLLALLPVASGGEVFTTLVERPGVRIERIVSHGQAGASGEWYDQAHDEFVLVIQGRAQLEIEGRKDLLDLCAGHWVDLPAHTRHRVAWTAPDEDTVWLAIHSPCHQTM
jgi:cupin 2 domain-containing protein